MIVGIVIGIVLVVGAGVAIGFALHNRKRWHAMLGTETSTAAELNQELGTVHALGGGGLRRICEVTGSAQPGPEGELRSELGQLPCVWYRYEVRRRYWDVTTDSEGRQRRTQKTEMVASLASSPAFRLADPSGSVLVRPDGLAIDRAERVVDRFVPDEGGDSVSFLGIQLNRRDNTIGYEHEEWLVRAGTRLYVLGEATSDHNGEIVVGKPAAGVHIISTRDEQQLRAAAQKAQRLLMWGALGGLVLGIGLIVGFAVA